MKSPFTGGESILKKKWMQLEFRKEAFPVLYHYYQCTDTGEEFTTVELDELNIVQLHNQYRTKYGIPSPREIAGIREKYGLSAARMSELLGLGTNEYRRYESGAMPTVANGRLINMISDPEQFHRYLANSKNLWSESDFHKMEQKIGVEEIDPLKKWIQAIMQDFSATSELIPTAFTGYVKPSLQKVSAVAHYFAYVMKPYKTAMNKLFFYADFAHYRRTGFGITGLRYNALQFGPVPDNYDILYSWLVEEKVIHKKAEIRHDEICEQFMANKPNEGGDSILSPSEMSILKEVAKKLKGKSTKEIVDISHKETAWTKNVVEGKDINYNEAFELQLL